MKTLRKVLPVVAIALAVVAAPAQAKPTKLSKPQIKALHHRLGDVTIEWSEAAYKKGPKSPQAQRDLGIAIHLTQHWINALAPGKCRTAMAGLNARYRMIREQFDEKWESGVWADRLTTPLFEVFYRGNCANVSRHWYG